MPVSKHRKGQKQKAKSHLTDAKGENTLRLKQQRTAKRQAIFRAAHGESYQDSIDAQIANKYVSEQLDKQ